MVTERQTNYVCVCTYLLPISSDVLKGLGIVDSEHEQESFAGSHVLISHGTAVGKQLL